MMPVIRISDATWTRLQAHARPFEDTPEDIVRKALDALEGTSLLKPVSQPRVAASPAVREAKLPQKEFRQPLLSILLELGGSADSGLVRDRIFHQMKDRLLQGDLNIVSSGDPRWWNATCWERNDLKKEGLLRSDSPRGVWQLTAEGLAVAKRQR
jgi:hypothetical protein